MKKQSFVRRVFRFCFGFLVLLSACQSEKADRLAEAPPANPPDSIYFSEEKFSLLSLDSNRLFRFLDSSAEPPSGKKALITFYRKRNFQFAWLEKGSISPAAQDFFLQYRGFLSDYSDTLLPDPVLDSLLYQLASDGFEKQGQGPLEELEMRLSLAFLRYARKEFTGLIDRPELLNWHIPKYKKNYPALLDSLAAGKRPGNFMEPVNAYYTSLKAALGQYKRLEQSGQWPKVPDWNPPPGAKSMDLRAVWLKKCLLLAGDLRPADTLTGTDSAVAGALRSFQNRMGLPETGQADQATIEQMRVPLRKRLRQIMVNLERMRWLPEKIKGDFLLVNIPEFTLHVFRDGNPIWDSKLVVGKQASKTQIFRGKISHIILNPIWSLPPGIIKKEILPGIKKHPDYLRRHHMQVFSGSSRVNAARINWHRYTNRIPYSIRQMPGPDNPLGRIKFLFPNSFWIFLHDSNEPWFFDARKRTFSHGCIRMEKAEQLAEYLLKKNAGMTDMQIRKALGGKKEAYYKLRKQEPVYIIYLTAWVDERGKLNFRPDVYGRDALLYKAVFGNSGE